MCCNSEQVTLRENYTVMEANEPTSNLVYFARSLTFGKSFCLSVSQVLNNGSRDFSFIVGFTTCSASIILAENLRHLTEQCTPTGCGGHSQQLKVLNANAGYRVTFERQANGYIYFAINKAMPICVKFDSTSCAINLTRHRQLVPYIQLSGSVLALRIEDETRQLNVRSAIAVRPLATVTAFGPPIPRESQVSSRISTEFEAHHAYVASLPDADTHFIKLSYPETDIKLSVNRMAVLRKNKFGERFVFYVHKLLKFETQITFQVTKVYNGHNYTGGFVFGVSTACPKAIKENERQFSKKFEVFPSQTDSVVINRDVKLDDIFTFTRSAAGQIVITKNGEVQEDVKLILEGFHQTENVIPFIVLNGIVSGIMITSSSSGGTNIEFSRVHTLPPIDFKITKNISVLDHTLLRWNSKSGQEGVIVNAKPFEKVLKFIIREVQTSTSTMSLTFGLIDSTHVGFSTPQEIRTRLDMRHDNLIEMPAMGLKFSLFQTQYGKVTLKYDARECAPLTLFKVDLSKRYYPVLILDGSVTAIELLPNPTNQLVKHIPTEQNISVPSERTSSAQTPHALPISPPINDCKICMDNTINSAFIPCGHRFACYACAELWRRSDDSHNGDGFNCPLCRQAIREVLRTFD